MDDHRPEPGTPVIANDAEEACTKMVCIITCYSRAGAPRLRYLSAWDRLPSKPFTGEMERITPLEAFGVSIELNHGTGAFRCVPIPGATSTATYPDGETRLWQQKDNDRQWWPYRPSVLAVYQSLMAHLIGGHEKHQGLWFRKP